MLLQYLKKKNQKPLYEALQKIKEGHHSHLHSSVSLYYNLYGFWVYIYIYFIFYFYFLLGKCRVDAFGVHITPTHGVPSSNCQNLHIRGLSQQVVAL
jgi:predicted PurR-regulated permease PerM